MLKTKLPYFFHTESMYLSQGNFYYHAVILLAKHMQILYRIWNEVNFAHSLAILLSLRLTQPKMIYLNWFQLIKRLAFQAVYNAITFHLVNHNAFQLPPPFNNVLLLPVIPPNWTRSSQIPISIGQSIFLILLILLCNSGSVSYCYILHSKHRLWLQECHRLCCWSDVVLKYANVRSHNNN